MNQGNQEHALRPQSETTAISDENTSSGKGFEISPDDARSVENRDGLETVVEHTTEKLDYEPSAQDLGPATDEQSS